MTIDMPDVFWAGFNDELEKVSGPKLHAGAKLIAEGAGEFAGAGIRGAGRIGGESMQGLGTMLRNWGQRAAKTEGQRAAHMGDRGRGMQMEATHNLGGHSTPPGVTTWGERLRATHTPPLTGPARAPQIARDELGYFLEQFGKNRRALARSRTGLRERAGDALAAAGQRTVDAVT